MSGSEDSGLLTATGEVKPSPALLLLVYSILQLELEIKLSQSVHVTSTLLPKAAIEGFFESVPGLLLILIGLLKLAPPSVLATKNVSESLPSAEVLKSCHVTYTLFPSTATSPDQLFARGPGFNTTGGPKLTPPSVLFTMTI
jgi:hypothetical protein